MIKIVVIFIVQIVLQIVNNLFLIDCSQQQQWWRFIKEEKIIIFVLIQMH